MANRPAMAVVQSHAADFGDDQPPDHDKRRRACKSRSVCASLNFVFQCQTEVRRPVLSTPLLAVYTPQGSIRKSLRFDHDCQDLRIYPSVSQPTQSRVVKA